MTDPEDQHPDSQSPTPADPIESDTSARSADAEPSAGITSLSLTALLIPLPWYLWSVVVVYWTATLFVEGPWARTILGVWLLCGVLMLWRPLEEAVTRLALRLRYPIQSESDKLAGPWAAATTTTKVGRGYTLMIDDSDDLTASGLGGRVVAVTQQSLKLPPPRLEAVIGHELGHHVHGYDMLRAAGLWYALPARAATWLIMNFGRIMGTAPVVGCLVSGFFLLSVLGIILTSLIFDEVPVPLFGIALFFLAPVVLAGVDRVGERNADRVAARWGYGAALLEVLNEVHEAERQEKGKPKAGLLSSQPAVADRIRSLERYLSRESS